ncbi:hypothetical protein SISSUDRAFT_1031636 [Sistotremastrum suecicum HHB10207 ss-3]|uniref:Uncharacterized protein n=1 Tax=Sistotremastrum suecicum HHB10207 ss-3 TaxID=1314776 RepID=A0A166FQP4_9AGAM|nr:hypothetical protein SISSUDRAFT_1031636 [Sistotremastrum suecicum HHB10207 ss-3]
MSTEATPTTAPLNITDTLSRFRPLHQAFQIEEEEDEHDRDFMSLQRVTADVVRPLIYTSNKVALDYLLRSLASEFLQNLTAEVASQPPYYPTGDQAWVEAFPYLEERQAADNRFYALHIINLMADTVPAIARQLSKDILFLEGILRLMFSTYIRFANPLGVEKGTPLHHHNVSDSSEANVSWLPQWRVAVRFLTFVAAVYDLDNVRLAWERVQSETKKGSEKVQSRNANLLEVFQTTISKLEAKGADSLHDNERMAIVELTQFLGLVIRGTSGPSPGILPTLRQELLKGRDTRVACGGCGTVYDKENLLQACDQCEPPSSS